MYWPRRWGHAYELREEDIDRVYSNRYYYATMNGSGPGLQPMLSKWLRNECGPYLKSRTHYPPVFYFLHEADLVTFKLKFL